jgi:4-hydroxy-tetrahydrodipicolinate reductase
MKLLLLGRGKTGSLVAEVARERGHGIEVLGAAENANAAALTPERLRGFDVVVDFTTPAAVLGNIAACARAPINMIVGTTGWYGEIPQVQRLVEQARIGFLYASNFSIGVNVFFDVARAASAAFRYGYSGHITETHHAQKKDKPSGTAAVLRKIVAESSGASLEIASVREGDVVGTHMLELTSSADRLVLTHEAKSRRGFAEGAVRAAEWIKGKRGFFDFQQVWRDMPS